MVTNGAPQAFLVYQMGKVGSSTVYASLRRADLPGPLYKVHYLSDAGLARGRARYAQLPVQVPVPYEETTEHVRRLLAERPELAWKVVSLVREPIARDVSAYVQMVDVLHPALVAGPVPAVRRIARAAGVQFIGFDERRSYLCEWFDEELRAVFGVDVFAQPFDHDAGCLRVRRGRLDLLVLRAEDLNRVGARVLSEFAGVPVPLTPASSRSPDKLQAAYVEPVYREILRQVRVPEPVCRRVYRSRYARHFYTAAEIDTFTARWSGARPAAAMRGEDER